MTDTRTEIEQLTPLQRALLAMKEMRARLDSLERAQSEPIAIVGLGCRFPGGATGPEGYWQLLSEGADAITEVPADRWDIEEYYDPDADAPGRMCTRYGGFLDRVDLFDPLFFGISPREAVSMDPQHRLLLEVSWEALERAGIAPERLAGSRTGVFLGICSNDYGMLALKSLPPERTDTYGSSGCATSIASGRLSYLLGLQGPSISVDTACSASLVAVHLACQSLRSRESDLALAAGVNVILMPEVTISFSRAHMMAPDGRCKTFDAAADGYVRGEGCGVVVLKRLSQALADRDPVLAVIRGSAVNQDGRSAGLTAPNGRAQEAVIREALSNAGVEPSQVNYIEAHGTGTSLGDPIEMRALGAAIGQGRSKDGPLVIGSVKTNIGHLEGAAGIAGLIKVVLALQRGEIPPQLHFKTPNPYIAWDELPVEVPTTRRPWPRGTARRIAGVSSFGFSGTNAHVIVEEAPIPEPATPGLDRPRHLLALSARTETALAELARQYEANFSASEPPALADACFTANAGRSHFSHRLALVVESVPDLTARLRAVAAGQEAPGLLRGTAVVGTPPKVAFLFTGQGAQYVGMGRQLFETSPLFRQALERCDELLRPHLDQPLLSVLYPKAGEASPLDETAYTQPALFALEWALAELWRSWGIEPTVVLGHSVGEYVAACVAGVFALEEGLKLIAARGRLMQALPHGGEMAAVFADEGRVRAAIAPYSREVSLAAVNGPESVVISGEGGAVREVTRRLATAGIKSQRLTVSHAFHSPLMEPMLAEFERVASGIRYEAPRVGLVSNLTGRLVTAREIDAAYWVRHLREPVRFQAGMEALNGLGHEVFVELGPIPTLLGMGRRCLQEGSGVWLPTLRQGRSDWEQALTSLGELYVRGANMDWAGFDRDYPRRKVSLPTYPFQRERYWVEVPSRRAPRGEDKIGQLLTPDPLTEWLYELAWQPQAGEPAKEIRPARPGSWLILADRGGVGAELAGLLEQQGERCRLVRPGGQEEPVPNGHDTIDPACPKDFDALVQAALRGAPPCRGVIHLWALDSGREEPTVASLQRVQTLGCASVLHLVQALARAEGVELPRLWLVTRGAQRVGSQARVAVAQAPVWGLGRTIALEQPNLHCMQVDLDPSDTGERGQALFQELWASGPEDQVAFRGENRYVARLVRAKAPVTAGGPGAIQADGTYLTTGGLGGLGLTVARWLVAQGARHLVLLGRREPRAEARQAIAAMEAQGARVRVFQADVSRHEDVTRILAEIEASLPPLRGIVHAAGVLDDGVLLQQNWGRFARVMAPKIEGAWNLHILTRHYPLDFFVLFSSMASLMGSPGQGNYAAANAFLDALAWQRRSEGLPGLSINWGPWAEVGMVAGLREQDQRRHGEKGVEPIPPMDGVRVFGDLLRDGAGPQVMVASIRWGRLLGQFPGGDVPAFLRNQARESSLATNATASPVERASIVRQIEDTPVAQRRDLILGHVRELALKVLGLPASYPLDFRKPLNEMGLDSLMAVELRNAFSASFGTTFPATLLFKYPTIQDLAQHLGERFAGAPAAEGQEVSSETGDKRGKLRRDLMAASRQRRCLQRRGISEASC